MPAVVGIDLGTSNTVVAHASGNDARAILDAEGRSLIPSIISIHPTKKILVGFPARERRIIDSKNTIFAVKRLIGRTWGTPEVEEAKKRLPFELRRGRNHAVQILARDELFTLPEISAFVLRKAKAVAEAALGTAVDRAVITVPANFNDLQREATKLSGALAGLEVMRILNEPTAAALAYGFANKIQNRVLVYDFGGGTFDVTLLEVHGGVFRVLATAGDMFLGGEDIDTALANKISDAFLRRHYYDPRANRETFQLVRDAAEVLKMQLSVQETATLDVEELMVGIGGKAINFVFSMTRAELTELVTPFVDRTLEVCGRAMSAARWTPRDIEQVILVGGSTRLTCVGQRVAAFFGRMPSTGVSPDDAVAIGAAIHALSLVGDVADPRGSAIARAAREAAPRSASQPATRPPPVDSDRPQHAPPQHAPPPPAPPAPHGPPYAPNGPPYAPPSAPMNAPPPGYRAPTPPYSGQPTFGAPSFTPALFAPRPPARQVGDESKIRRVPAWLWLLVAFLIALAGIIAAGLMLLPKY